MKNNTRIIDEPPFWFVNITTLCLAMTASVSLIYFGYLNMGNDTAKSEFESSLAKAELAKNPFDIAVIEAKSAVVYDAKRKIFIYEKNGEAQLPLASLTKLMTMIVALESAPEFLTVRIPPGLGEDEDGILSGEEWRLKDIADYALTASSNAAASSIARAVESVLDGTGSSSEHSSLPKFVDRMNKTASRIGMQETYYLNPTGLDETSSIGGAYGSARDMALLLAYIIENHREWIEATINTKLSVNSLSSRSIDAKNTNTRVGAIPGLVGSKTGFTDLAGGNLAIAFDASFGSPFIVVAMNSSIDGRFLDVETLVNATISYLGKNIGVAKK